MLYMVRIWDDDGFTVFNTVVESDLELSEFGEKIADIANVLNYDVFPTVLHSIEDVKHNVNMWNGESEDTTV